MKVNLKLIKDLFINNLSQGLQFGAQWVLSICILWVLGVEIFGEYSFYYSISNFLLPILPFGSFIFLLKEDLKNTKEGKESVKRSIQIQVIFFFAIFLVSILVNSLFFGNNGLLLLIISLFTGYFLSLNTLIFIYHKSLGDFHFELKINILKSFGVFLLICVIMFLKEIHVFTVLMSLLIINVITFIISLSFSSNFKTRDYINCFSFNLIRLKDRVIEQKYYGLQDILTASFVQGGMLILPLLLIHDIYGMYRGLLLIASPFGLLNLAFSQVLLNQLKNSSPVEKKKSFYNLQKIAIPILLLILGVLFIYREFVLEKIAKLSLNETTNIAFIGVCILILSSFIYSGYEMLLVSLEKQKKRFLIMVIGAIVNLVAIFVLLPQYGLIGAISTNIISSLVVFILIARIGESEMKKI